MALENHSLCPRVTLLPNRPCFPINTKHFRRLPRSLRKRNSSALSALRPSFSITLFHVTFTSVGDYRKLTLKTYRRLMAAYSVSGRVSTGSRHGDWPPRLIDLRVSLSRRAMTARGHGMGTSPLTSYAIPFRAPIGNSYSDPIFPFTVRLLVIHCRTIHSFCCLVHSLSHYFIR